MAHGGGGQATRMMMIMDGLTVSALTEVGRRRLRVALLAHAHIIIIIIVVGVIVIQFSVDAPRCIMSCSV